MRKLAKAVLRVLVTVVVLALLLWLLLARPAMVGSQPENLADNRVDVERLYRHVQVLSEEFSPRSYRDIENLNASAAYIRQVFESHGHQTQEQVFMAGGVEYRNVIANLGPLSGPKLVVGAHYDVAGQLPGADDNASGVAGLLELSRLLKDEVLNKTITLVAYSLEEPPYFASENMGSFVHARSEAEQGSEIDLMISLEMIGYFSEQPDSQQYPVPLLRLFYPGQGNFIAVVDQLLSNRARDIKVQMSSEIPLPVYSINAPSFITGIDFSDHRSYWSHGYDAVMITDTSFYRNTRYHTEEDTIDRLDFEKMGQVVHGVYRFIQRYQER